MVKLCADIGFVSLNHTGEQLCGDHVEIVKHGSATTVVLADGLGSGVKASILSTLTAKILSTMIAEGLTLEECVETVAATLPVCAERGIAYSTFTILHFTGEQEAQLIQFDNPPLILLREGKNVEYPYTESEIGGKRILRSRLNLQENDIFLAFSDGCIYAGVERTLNFGWERQNIIDYMEVFYQIGFSAKTLATILAEECNRLYEGRPGDDTTVVAVRLCRQQTVNLMIGPAAHKEDTDRVMTLFFEQEGKHIVCGGTTSTLVAEFLGKPLLPQLQFHDPDIPPTAELEGVDLVTEGIITISRVLEYVKDYLGANERYNDWGCQKDGASQITRILLEEATEIHFFVGKAINPAHQDPSLPINFNIKMRLIEELSGCLTKLGKQVKVSYY